jgi:hypothetical protein
VKTEDILKWVLIAGAAYLVYRYLSQSGLFSGLTAQPALPAASSAAVTTTAEPVAQPVAALPAPSASTQKVAITAQALLAFAGTQSWPNKPVNWDGKLTISQWNYMVSQMTGVDQQTDLSFGLSVPDPVTVDDYMARRVKAGISGLGALRLAELLPPVNAWSM